MSQSFECFSFLAEKTPTWAQDVEELQRRIAECQKEVAKLASPVVKKPRKSGSNESIRPGKEEEAIQTTDALEETKVEVDGQHSPPTATAVKEPYPVLQDAPMSSPGTNQSQPRQNKRKTASITSNTSGTPLKIRTRTMIVVYYDSVVQQTFEQLVKQISLGRNHVRRAKQAETMSRLTRSLRPEPKHSVSDYPLMPRLDLGATPSTEGTPVPPFRSTRSPIAPRGGEKDKPSSASTPASPNPTTQATKPLDTLTETDNLLEIAQIHCEKGAHQFLRDGECAAQTAAALKAFRAVAEISKKEMDKFAAEAREAERQRRERARLSDLAVTGDGATNGEREALSPEMEVGSGLLEVGDGTDEEGDEEFEMPLPPIAKFRAMART